MSSRLSTRSARSARLALAAVAMVAVTATLTACGPEETGADASSSSADKEAGKEAGSGSSGKNKGTDSNTDTDTETDNDVDGAKDEHYGDNSGAEGDNDVDGAKQDYYAKECDNGDLKFTVATFSEGHGYYLVTAKAKSGVICFLQGPPQQVMFGSDPDTVAANADQGAGDQIKLKGSTAAYLAVKPDSADTNNGKMFESLIVSVSDGGEAGMLKLLETEGLPVNKPIVTHWQTSADAAAYPFA